MIFHCPAPIYHRFTIFNFKCMFMQVMHLNKVAVTKRVLFSGGIKIQDGCQSWPLIAAKSLFLLYQLFWKKSDSHKHDKTKSFYTLGLVFITNDDVDKENLFLYIYKLSVVEKANGWPKREIFITRLLTNCHKFTIYSSRSIFVWWQILPN